MRAFSAIVLPPLLGVLLAPDPNSAAISLGDVAAPPHLAEARALLDAGKSKEALDKARDGLERAPDLPAMLDLASRAAQAAGAPDEALWYASIAAQELAQVAAPTKEEKACAEGLKKRLVELDPTGQKGPAAIEAYGAALFALGKECAGKKLYVNAVDLLTRAKATALSAAADSELAKIYDNKKAAEALLDSGLDVPIQKKKKRTPEAIAREDAKHATWETAWEIKGAQYTVKTDMGIELAESISLAMEQMNKFYRKVFHVKEHGGGQTARVRLSVYGSREEFDEWEGKDRDEPIDRNVAGFYRPGANYVATYDPRSDERSPASLWETLFHEASHQFTDLISADLIPTWLNEGTASYFEGARLRGNGIVETNLVPDERLEALEVMLRATETQSSKTGLAASKSGGPYPSLEDVVSYFEPGSYPGEYYPFGWGLVYFLLNYEDERSRRVYVEPYQAFTAAYKSGGKHDVKGRFVEHFVTRAKQPGIATFEDFEKRWRAWIHKLNELHFGGPEVADQLIERARTQAADKAWESAAESYAWALRKRPGDPVASYELAELLAARKLADAAIYRYRAAVASLRALEDPSDPLPSAVELTGTDLLDLSRKQIAKLDKGLSDQAAKADADFAAAAVDAARAYAAAERPLFALRLLDISRSLYGSAEALSAVRGEIAASSGLDTRRWRRPRIAEGLEDWEAPDEWKADGEALAVKCARPRFALWGEDLPERYTFEARLDVTSLEEGDGFLGMLFGSNSGGMQFVGFSADGQSEVGKLQKGWKALAPLPSIKKEKRGSFTVTIEIHPDKAEFFLDGKSAAKPRPYKPGELAGRIGFVVQSGSAKIADVRVRY